MTGSTAFQQKFGFRRDEVTLANWRTAPFNRWAFQNVAEIVPSVVQTYGQAQDETPADPAGILDREVASLDGTPTVRAFLERTHSDALAVMRRGEFVADWQAPHTRFGTPHLAFSISKSLTAIVAGILEGDGLLDPEAPVVTYVPEAANSAYGDATVRHVLDMTVSLDFEEAYLDPESVFARYRQAMLWNPGGNGESLLDLLCDLKRLPGLHGAVFRYRSPNSDMLGIIVERASGQRVCDLMRERLWEPLGIRGTVAVTVDRRGYARTAGGVSISPRDLARVGEMMRQGGIAGGKRIVAESWIRDTTTAGSRDAWLVGDFVNLLPEGRYRNKWYQSGKGWFCGIGIHGQWVVVDPATETVVVKMASQPEPVDDDMDRENVAFFEWLFTAA
ncbi:serine hydrolase [Mesorhizobium sp. 8]|uniref:serine hydrolase domain-containing protein n=1 Tax=Mesorhizobium sp. 8 TaxID=2584466 RepID=UPI001120B0AF|nr:serine hydrolase [Mesorhizobium sp. 8]QDC02477.1 serine hydrolase [Mesorhizobium sp. 8]